MIPGMTKCSYCGAWHEGVCPRVAELEYHPSGALKRVRLHTGQPQSQAPVTVETPASALAQAATGDRDGDEPVGKLNISSRSQKTLKSAGIKTIGGLASKTRTELEAISGIGGKSIEEIVHALHKHGLTLRTPADKPACGGLGLTGEQRTEVEDATRELDQTAGSMLCIAAGVDSTDKLTQATLPAFREALAAHKAGVAAA